MKRRKLAARIRRIVLFAVLAFLALCVFLGLLFWVGSLMGQVGLARRGIGGEPTLEADSTDYQRLENGNLQYEGTEYIYNTNLVTILLLGIDKSEARLSSGFTSGEGQADTIVLAVLDRETGKLKLICVPRDTMTEIQFCDIYGEPAISATEHLALQYTYGGGNELSCQHMAETVSRMMSNVKINAYCSVDMDAISVASTTLGGIPITIPDDPYYCAYTGYTPGQWVNFSGEAALQFVQYRDLTIFASCEMRIERQKAFLDAAIDRFKLYIRKKPLIILHTYWMLRNDLWTDLNATSLMSLAASAQKINMRQLEITTLPGEVRQGQKYEEFYPDEAAMQKIILDTWYLPAA